MDFLKEAANMDEFSRNNASVQYVTTPKLYHEYSTGQVLVMEYIDGYPLDDGTSFGKRPPHHDKRHSRNRFT